MHKTSKMYWSADSWRQTNWKVWLKVKQHVKKSIGTIDRGTDNMRACTRNQSKQQATVQTIQNENKYKSLYINSTYMHSAQRPIWMSTGIAQFRAHLSCPLSCNCKRKQQTNTSIKYEEKNGNKAQTNWITPIWLCQPTILLIPNAHTRHSTNTINLLTQTCQNSFENCKIIN